MVTGVFCLCFRSRQKYGSVMSFRAPESLSEQIAQHLAQQIVTGDLVEGEHIQELRIAKELDVSRGSVREALLILARRRLIEIYPRRGAIVSEMSAQQVRGLYEVVSLLLQLLVRKMAENWRQQDSDFFVIPIQHLQGLVDSHDSEGFYESAFELFRMAYRFVANPYIEEILEDLRPAVRRSYFLALHVDHRELEEAFSFLKGMVDSVLMRKGEQAAAQAADFCSHQRSLVLESLMRVKQVEAAWAQRQRR
jgi:DNA-binding GntR family transcriptional regulator